MKQNYAHYLGNKYYHDIASFEKEAIESAKVMSKATGTEVKPFITRNIPAHMIPDDLSVMYIGKWEASVLGDPNVRYKKYKYMDFETSKKKLKSCKVGTAKFFGVGIVNGLTIDSHIADLLKAKLKVDKEFDLNNLLMKKHCGHFYVVSRLIVKDKLSSIIRLIKEIYKEINAELDKDGNIIYETYENGEFKMNSNNEKVICLKDKKDRTTIKVLVSAEYVPLPEEVVINDVRFSRTLVKFENALLSSNKYAEQKMALDFIEGYQLKDLSKKARLNITNTTLDSYTVKAE